jgi:hypothetical protein
MKCQRYHSKLVIHTDHCLLIEMCDIRRYLHEQLYQAFPTFPSRLAAFGLLWPRNATLGSRLALVWMLSLSLKADLVSRADTSWRRNLSYPRCIFLEATYPVHRRRSIVHWDIRHQTDSVRRAHNNLPRRLIKPPRRYGLRLAGNLDCDGVGPNDDRFALFIH